MYGKQTQKADGRMSSLMWENMSRKGVSPGFLSCEVLPKKYLLLCPLLLFFPLSYVPSVFCAEQCVHGYRPARPGGESSVHRAVDVETVTLFNGSICRCVSASNPQKTR